jgi:hypothetical protein
MADEKEPDKPEEPLTDLDLRMFIIEHMANSDIMPEALIPNMDAAFKWLRDGTVPAKEAARRTPRLKLEANG